MKVGVCFYDIIENLLCVCVYLVPEISLSLSLFLSLFIYLGFGPKNFFSLSLSLLVGNATTATPKENNMCVRVSDNAYVTSSRRLVIILNESTMGNKFSLRCDYLLQ